METILTVFNKIVFLLLLTLAGILAKKFKLLSDHGEEDLSRLLVDLFWPALILFSITKNLNQQDILSNISLPLFAIITCITGFIIGSIIVKIFHYKEARKKIFLYDSQVLKNKCLKK